MTSYIWIVCCDGHNCKVRGWKYWKRLKLLFHYSCFFGSVTCYCSEQIAVICLRKNCWLLFSCVVLFVFSCEWCDGLLLVNMLFLAFVWIVMAGGSFRWAPCFWDCVSYLCSCTVSLFGNDLAPLVFCFCNIVASFLMKVRALSFQGVSYSWNTKASFSMKVRHLFF
jgi:hypothetical protein